MEKCLAEIRISFLLLTSVRKVLNSARVERNPGRISHLPIRRISPVLTLAILKCGNSARLPSRGRFCAWFGDGANGRKPAVKCVRVLLKRNGLASMPEIWGR